MKHYIYILLTMIAIPTVTFAQKVDGRKVRGHVRDGNKAYEQKLYGKAQESFEDALLIDKIDKTAIYNLANTYYKERMWDEAIAKYQEFLSLESKDQKAISEAWHNMGNALLQKEGAKSKDSMSQGQQGQGQQEQVDFLKESIEAYKNALRFNPEDDEARYNLAVAQRMVKDQDGGGGGGGDDKNKDDQQNQDQNKDKDKDKDKDKSDEKDKNKDQNKGQDKDQQKQDSQDQQEGGMSKQNMEQLLKALEQDEKDTQRRVNAQRAKERQKQNMQNRELDKDW